MRNAITAIILALIAAFAFAATYDTPGISGGSSTGWTLVTSTTASASATVDFSVDGTSDRWKVDFVGVRPATDNADLYLRFSDDNGSTFESTNYKQNFTAQSSSGAAIQRTTTGLTTAILIVENVGNASDEAANGYVLLFEPASTSHHKQIESEAVMESSGDTIVMNEVNAGWDDGTTSAVTNIRFLMDTGNIAEGEFYLYKWVD